jgi:DNA-binding CsgD family transcriptional regulator
LISSFLNNVNDEDNVTNIKLIRKNNYPYVFIWIIYYAWVVVFTTWWTASPLIDHNYGTEIRNIIHAVNLISSAVFIFILKKERFVEYARIGSVMVVVSAAIFLISQNPAFSAVAAIITAIFIGFINISILIPFVFILNNTEKFYAVVTSNILINILSYAKDAFGNGNLQIVPQIGSFVILVAGLSCVLFFNKKDSCFDDTENNVYMPKRVYITLIINCIFAIICKGMAKGILNIAVTGSEFKLLNLYYLGGVIGCILYFFIYKLTKKAIHLSWNLTFGFIIMGLLCFSFIDQIQEIIILFALFLGAGSTMGMVNMYYILGVIGKKYNNIKYVRYSILFIGICGGLSGVLIGNLIYEINVFNVSIIASIISASSMILFLIISPILTNIYYSDEWVDDSQKAEIDNERIYMFKKYSLSKREIEVCKLLLKGYTMRQISAIISISYSTVNTYCTSLYRKLGINSRTELLIIFKDYPINIIKNSTH